MCPSLKSINRNVLVRPKPDLTQQHACCYYWKGEDQDLVFSNCVSAYVSRALVIMIVMGQSPPHRLSSSCQCLRLSSSCQCLRLSSSCQCLRLHARLFYSPRASLLLSTRVSSTLHARLFYSPRASLPLSTREGRARFYYSIKLTSHVLFWSSRVTLVILFVWNLYFQTSMVKSVFWYKCAQYFKYI